MILMVIQDLRKTVENLKEIFIKDPEELKYKQKEIDNKLEGINSRITKVEEQINNLKYRMVEITATEQNIENRIKKEMKTAEGIYGTTFTFYRSQEERERKDLRKYLKR